MGLPARQPRGSWQEPQNLGPNINTVNNDLAPTLSYDGHWIYFARPGDCGGADLWVSWREDTEDDLAWAPSTNLGCIVNSPEFDSGPAYYKDNETGIVTLYFASDRPGAGSFDIYASTLGENGSWNPAVLIEELSTPQWDAGPDIRRDGLEIFFQSNRPGSIGGRLDLWVSTRKTTQDAWSKPVNLGPTVNTEYVEHGPSLSRDGTTLYFDSDRPGGVGGRDIYVITRTKLQ